MILKIELVPTTAWGCNLRSILSKKEWDFIRKESYKKTNYRCEICDGVGIYGKGHPVECHEVWEYDDVNHVQKLVGVQSLCVACHRVKHAGLWCMKGQKHFIINHLMKINRINYVEANKQLSEAFKIHENRSNYNWELDLEYLKYIIKPICEN